MGSNLPHRKLQQSAAVQGGFLSLLRGSGTFQADADFSYAGANAIALVQLVFLRRSMLS